MSERADSRDVGIIEVDSTDYDPVEIDPAETGPTDFDPRQHRLEPELDEPTPRRVPALFRHGHYATRRRRQSLALLIAGALCYALSPLPLIERWSVTVLLLGYLEWIGLGLLALAVLPQMPRFLQRSPYRYFVHGTPSVVRIVHLGLVPERLIKWYGEGFRYVATIRRRDPMTGTMEQVQVRSKWMSVWGRETTACSYRVGDYVTALSIGDGGEEDLQLYGFLGLAPGLGIVSKASGRSIGRWIAHFAYIVALAAVPCWSIWAAGRYKTIDYSLAHGWSIALGSFAGIALLVLWARRDDRRHQRLREEDDRRTREARALGEAVEMGPELRTTFQILGPWRTLACIAGAPFAGAIVGLAGVNAANALLDRSPAVPTPVRIVELTQKTSEVLTRHYAVAYVIPGHERKVRRFPTDPWQMSRFASQGAVAMVRAGRFGWPWVETLVPAGDLPEESDESDPSEPPVE